MNAYEKMELGRTLITVAVVMYLLVNGYIINGGVVVALLSFIAGVSFPTTNLVQRLVFSNAGSVGKTAKKSG